MGNLSSLECINCACSGDEIAPAAAGANNVNVFERLALVAEHKKVRMLDLFRMVCSLPILPHLYDYSFCSSMLCSSVYRITKAVPKTILRRCTPVKRFGCLLL